MGPHPAVAATRRAVRQALDGIPVDVPLLLACSGGADSTALAAAASFVAARQGRRAALATVDHALQDGSADRAQAVAALGARLGLHPARVLRVRVGAGPGSGGPESAARDARYAALAEALRELSAPGTAPAALLLGHTRDDQAETVLLGLGRGAGPRSLAGMATASARPEGLFVRPFLGLDRATARAACQAQDLPVWDDPHNQDPRFRRVRIRHEALPVLEDVLGGGVAGALARTAALLREDLESLDVLAGRELAGRIAADGALAVAGLAEAPRAIRTRVLRQWLRDAHAPALSYPHLDDLDRLVASWHGQGAVDLPGGFSVLRASGRLVLNCPTALSSPQE